MRERAKNRSVREQMCVASALIWKTEESEYEESHVTRNGMILLGRVTAMGTKKGKEKKNKKGTLDNQAEFSDDHKSENEETHKPRCFRQHTHVY